MNKNFYWALGSLLVLRISCTQAQIEYSTGNQVRIYTPAYKAYTDIDGSPFIPSDTVQRGWLVNGTKRVATRLHYNAYAGTVEYLEGKTILNPPNSVNEFIILAADTMRFQKGFPAMTNRSANDFYQVLFDGRKTKLLKATIATVYTNTDRMANDYGRRAFQLRDDYYVWLPTTQSATASLPVKVSDGELKVIVINKKSLMSIFPQQADLINRYISEQHLKVKSWAEFASVLKYLDTQ